MNELAKALGFFLAANAQACGILWFAYKAIGYLEENYPKSFGWNIVIWPLALASVAYMYIKIIKALLQSEKRDKTKKLK